ncbi:unnamed protein product [Parnassius apollo]|uniref:(apollo) hypothetical protein n=1 Tax=Parnassius apollo TaxID=110799 RepID=A0A8S3Y094_PARAO|nr:unnamed protein product [Parnassius apollo]
MAHRPSAGTVDMRKRALLQSAATNEDRLENGQSGTHDTSLNISTMPQSTLVAAANKLLQDTKSQIEQSGNLKTSIKEKVLYGITGMYEIILRMSESRQTLQLQLEKSKLSVKEELLRKEKEYAEKLEGLLETSNGANAKGTVRDILKELASVRQILTQDAAGKK